MTRILCTLAAVVLASIAVGAEYHVRPDGDDERCKGRVSAAAEQAPDCAFATPQRCADTAGPGDSCVIHAGVYTACPSRPVPTWPVAAPRSRQAILTIHGKKASAEKPLVIRGAGDGEVVFEGTNGCDYGILHVSSSHVTYGGPEPFRGFVFRGEFDHNQGRDDQNQHVSDGGTVLIWNGRGNRLLGLEMEGVEFAEWQGAHGPGKNELAEIMVHRQAQDAVEVAYNTVRLRDAKYGIALPHSAHCGGNSCEDTGPNIHHNTVIEAKHGIRHIGIYVKGAGHARIHDNFVQLGTPERPSANSQLLYVRDAYGASIYNNYLEHYGEGHGLYVQDTHHDNTEGHRIYNNHFVGSGRMGCWCFPCDDCEIRNNLVAGLNDGRWRHGITCSPATSGGAWGYNAFYRIEDRSYWGGGNRRCSSDDCGATCDPEESNLYDVDPRLIGDGAIPVPCFRLAAGSPLIDAGIGAPAAPTHDYDGEPRSLPDIGADERRGGD